MARGRISALLLATAIALGSPSAEAQGDIDQARAMAQEAADLLEAGEYERALERATQAEDLYHAPIHLLMIGQAQEALGRLAQAAETYERLVAEPLAANASPVFREAQETGAANLKALSAMLPSLLLVVSGPPMSAAKATVDGQPVKLTGRAVRVDPGPHEIRVEAEGYATYEETVTLPHKGGVVKVDVALLKPSEGLPTTPGPDEGPDTGEKEGSYVPAVVAFGVGGAGLVVGAITGIMFLGRMSDLNDRCPNDQCAPEDQPEIDSAGTLGNVSTIGFGVAIVGAAVGAILLATRDTSSATVSVGGVTMAPWLGVESAGTGSAGIVGSF